MPKFSRKTSYSLRNFCSDNRVPFRYFNDVNSPDFESFLNEQKPDLLVSTMNTSLNEAVKTFKGSSSNLSICFDIENRGDYKEQIGLYQKIKDFCNENNLNISFSSEITQDNDEENSIEYVNKVNPTLFLSLRNSVDLKVNFFQGKHSSSSIGERISTKIESSMGFVAEGRSLSVLKNTKSVSITINGNFYQIEKIAELLNFLFELLNKRFQN